MKLIENLQTNSFSDNDFVESFSIIASRIDITEINTSIFSTRAVVFKFSILKIVSVISRKTSQAEKINQLNKSNVVSSAVNSVWIQIQFFNFDKEIFAFFYQSKHSTYRIWILVCHQWKCFKWNFSKRHCRADFEKNLAVEYNEIVWNCSIWSEWTTFECVQQCDRVHFRYWWLYCFDLCLRWSSQYFTLQN